jgi:tetratricopeptide (TPR) repeat protein
MNQYTFLYQATNPEGKTVTERIEAENRQQAKYFLEIRGYSEIDFQTGEVRDEVWKTFESLNENPVNKVSPEIELQTQFLGILEGIAFSLKSWSIVWLPLFGWTIYSYIYGYTLWWSLTLLIAFIIYFVFINLPSIFYKTLVYAGDWARWDEVRKLVGIIEKFNKISPLKIPQIELDSRLAYADAAEGKLDQALLRMRKYEGDEKISNYILYSKMAIIYERAKNYAKKLEYQERTVKEFPDRSETYLDCAFTEVRYFQNTSKAREYLNIAEEKELGGIFSMFIPFCQGLIEFEEGNLQKAEFSLISSLERLKPYEQAGLFTGIIFELKAYLSLLYGRMGNRHKAENYLNEIKPFLLANNDTELLERCEEAMS